MPDRLQNNPTVMHFFGVQTEGSSAMKLFPQWADVFSLGAATLVGVDLPLEAPHTRYREAVMRLKADSQIAGALVTSHKLNVVRAARDLFDGLTDEAELCGEVSAIYKRDGRLWGHADDPKTNSQAMRHFLGADYWQRHPEAVILSLGAGGAAVAMVVSLLTRAPHRPRSLILVDTQEDRLHHLQVILDQFPDSDLRVELRHNAEARANDRMMADLPPFSLVVNATGMGKDRPGSPVTDAGVFPQNGAAWELNYRGERLFLQQARRQAAARNLTVEDGWRYFLLGWSSVISQVFASTLTPDQFERFAAVSEKIR